jgi:hypothetical protein
MNAHVLTPIKIQVTECPCCQQAPTAGSPAKACSKCGATAAERCFGGLLRGILRNYDPKTAADPIVVAAHRLSVREKALVETIGRALPTPTQTWVDINDPAVMNRVVSLDGSASLSADIFYCTPTSLDFVPEMAAALASAARVLRGTGILMFGFNPGRVVDGEAAPTKKYKLDPAIYKLPPTTDMWSMEVGRLWVIAELRKLGLAPNMVLVEDLMSGTTAEYFLGQRAA